MHIGMLLYPGLTQLDLTGPFEVFHRLPDSQVHLVWKERGLIRADSGLGLEASTAFADCPPLDLIFVPGFSTAPAVTNVSGRGVGMDVVKNRVEAIGGSVEVSSTLGAGSTFRLTIPGTLAIRPGVAACRCPAR